MLREELLQSKNDEIARCLLSRKRKLSELYFATVGFAGATDGSPQRSLYIQKEQAFLDANDLTKGRYYREDTLPRRPDVAIIHPILGDEEPGQKSLDIGEEHRAAQKSTAEINVDTREAAETSSRVLPVPATDGTDRSRVEQSSAQSQRSNLSVDVSRGPGISPVSSRVDGEAGITDLHPRDVSSEAHPPASASVKSVSEATDHDEAFSAVPSSRNSSATERTPVSSPTKASSESIPGAGPVSKPQGDTTLLTTPYSGVAPTTPDEQLQFEAAQSLQNASADGEKPNIPAQVSEEPTAVNGDKTPAPVSVDRKPLGVDSKLNGDALARNMEPTTPSTPFSETPGQANWPASGVLQKGQLASSLTQPQSERMTTRVSSGALRHKSVSEILGETPKYVTSQADKVSHERQPAESPVSDSNTSTLTNRLRLKDRRSGGEDRSKLSTVVFPRKQPGDKSLSMQLARRSAGGISKDLNEENDYLFTLFQSKAHRPPHSTNISALLSTAHKTLSTSNHLLDYREQMDSRTLKKIYQLQNMGRWPLRQYQRSVEPPRPGSHWDVLLDHVKWMRTDFREERKWKITAAKRCADWCAEYVASNPQERAILLVNARSPPVWTATDDSEMHDAPRDQPDEGSAHSHPTPDLIPSMEDDSVSEGYDDFHPDFSDTVVPAAIFSLGSDEFTFHMDKTPTSEKLLEELPLYCPLTISPETNLPTFKAPPDTDWRRELVPVTKFATGTIEFRDRRAPRKRSRYDYGDSDDDEDMDNTDISPEQRNVALFQPENKHIRDRIHPGQSFRPPSECPMPTLGFLESRQSSHWTYAEDDELRRLVEEFSFNWSLISECLSSRSQYTSGPERRTPWECFERWVGLEGIPTDMAKIPYFRAYSARLEAAQRNVLAAQQAAHQQQQQQQGQGQQAVPPGLIRRRTTQPVRVDRRRSSKHLALLDGMRKLSKKRETMLQKQHHATQMASIRKVTESNHPRPPVSTPAEFSVMKHEREVKLQERQEQYRQQMLAHQRAAMAQRIAQQQQQQQSQQQSQPAPNQAPLVNGGIPGRPPGGIPHNVGQGIPGHVPGIPNGVPANVAMNQGRPHPSLQGIPNGAGINGPMPPAAMAMKMVPQAGLPQSMNGRPGVATQASPDNARIMREASRLQEQQRLLQSRQQQHQFQNQQPFIPQGPHSSPNMNMASVNLNGNPNNPAMLAAFQAASGVGSPSFHASSVASPRMNQPNPLSNPAAAMPTVNSIQASIQRNNPNMPPDQAAKLATERLHQYQQQRMSQAAMNAAAGNMGSIPAGFQMPDGTAPLQASQAQGYSPLMRVNQSGQRPNVGSPAMSGMVLQQSRSATPHRTGSAQGGPVGGPGPGPGSNQSPRPPQAQMANG